MSSTGGTSKSKKGFRGLLRNPFSRSSSHLPAPSTSSPPTTRASFSSVVPNQVQTSSPGSGELGVPPSTSERPGALHSASPPGAISAVADEPANPLPDPADTPTPTEPTPPVKNVVWMGLKTSLQGLRDNPGMFSHLSLAAGILLECFEGVETAARNQEDYEELAKELTALSGSLADLIKSPTPFTKSISNFEIDIEQQAKEIKDRMTRGRSGLFLAAKEDEEDVVKRYRRIQSLFRQLQANLSVSTWSIANEHLVNTRLEGLNPVKQATYDSQLSSVVNRRKCTEGTRERVLSDLDEWVDASDKPNVYWMSGMAGTGKTTIACTFSGRLEAKEKLAASFFCTRTSADCRDVARIIPTIAYQLARYSIPFQSALYEILGKEPDAGSKNAEKQFERLLRDPLEKVKNAMPDNLVVVIDALDECDDHSGVEGFLNIIFRYAPDIPLKFLVTSRPEPEIYKRMTAHSQSHSVVHLHDIESSLVQADIALYLKEELAPLSLSPTQIGQLVDQSGALFIYAATLVRYIRSGPNPGRRLGLVLSMTPAATRKHAQIDALYTAVLKSALNQEEMEEEEMEDIRVVLRMVLFAQEPIDIETVGVLSGVNDASRVEAALLPLKSVLHQSELTGLVSTLHASFPDFMFSNERSGEYFCDIVEHGHVLAERCFLAMKELLRFNICELESSFVPDEKVDDLQDRVQQNISPTLGYACRYWGSHLALASKSDALLKMLEEFLSDRLLFWMEVLNLKQGMATGMETIFKAKLWLNQTGTTASELVMLLEDARNFVTGFANSPASQSTPHIYISCLPFCPRSSSVYKNYWKRTRGLLELKGSLMERREGAALATWNVGSKVYSVSYSPDGTKVAVGCNDHTVRILNAHNGMPLVEPLKGHTSIVHSVAFSPDGKLVASASDDGTIRVWNAHNGTPVSGPFEGHTDRVNSVSFSPDGMHIVSGSADNTIRIWNASDGTHFKGPFTGHIHYVTSVAFSPNGALIASASSDETIRLWNSHHDTPAASPFKGHTNWVRSVSFTPDGTRLVSGSHDRTIRVWKVSDRSLVAGPFEGHTDRILSVAVSPDGTRVASGSHDRTVRVWNIDDGTLATGPFVGHTEDIYSVAYSPDGTRVISGSWDNTIRVWNVRAGLSVPAPFEDHIAQLTSISLFVSGTRILSGSDDRTAWVWDIDPEQVVANRFEGNFLHPNPTHSYPTDGAKNFLFTLEHQIQIMDITSKSVAATLSGHTGPITSSVYSADGNLLVTGSKDCTIRIWDLQQAKLAAGPFQGHRGQVKSVGISSDSLRVVSCSDKDKTIRIWNVANTVLHAARLHNPLANPSSTRDQTHTLEGWSLQDDGWVTNSSSELLFWIPSDIVAIHACPTPHTEFIITKNGVLHIPQQELRIGYQWSRCYVSD